MNTKRLRLGKSGGGEESFWGNKIIYIILEVLEKDCLKETSSSNHRKADCGTRKVEKIMAISCLGA